MKSLDLMTLIKNHNRLHPDRYISTEKTWGLSYLSSDGLALLNAAQKITSDIKRSHSHRNQVNRFGSIRHSLDALKRTKPTCEFFKQAKTICTSLKDATTSQKIHTWEQEQAAWLNDDNNWEKLIAINSEAKGSLLKLKNLWDRQKTFSLCSNDFLIQALKALDEPLKHLMLAEEEYRKRQHKLPNFIAENYGTFLTKLRHEFNETKKVLLNTMLTRLAIADRLSSSSGHFHNDDVLVYTIKELQKFGIIKKSMGVKGHWQTLQPKHFYAFQTIIQSHGSQHQVRELLQLSYFDQNKGALNLKKITIDNMHYIAPSSLKKYIPSHKRWPSWIFKNQHRCIDFVQRNQQTFASLNIEFPNVALFEQHARFRCIDRYEQQLNRSMQELQQSKPKSWELWFYFGYRKLLEDYQTILMQQSERCYEARIKLLEQIANIELPPKTYNERYKGWIMLREQLSNLSKSNLSSDLKMRVSKVSSKLSVIYKQEPEEYAACLIQCLTEKQQLQIDEVNYLLGYIEIINLSLKKSNWMTLVENTITAAIKVLADQLKTHLIKQEIENDSQNIMIIFRLIKALEQNSQVSCLPNIIKQALEHQKIFLTNDEPHVANMRLLYIQKLVSEFGDSESTDSLTRKILDFTSNNRVTLRNSSREQMADTKTSLMTREMSSTDPSFNINRDTITAKTCFFTSNRDYSGYRMNSSVSIRPDNHHVLSKSY